MCLRFLYIKYINTFRVPEQLPDETKARSAPVFVSRPDSVTVEEGEWARFQCRVTGHPKPRVMWLLNGNTIVNVRKISFTCSKLIENV